MSKTEQNWAKRTKIGQNGQEIGKIGPNWAKWAKIGQNGPKIGQNGPKLGKMGQHWARNFRREWSEIGNKLEKSFKNGEKL